MLSVQVYQQCTELRQHRGSSRTAVHPCPGPALSRDLPPDHHAALVDIESQFLDLPSRARVDALERALDDRLCRTRSDTAARCAIAEQERERVNQHGFAGACLTGEHIPSWAELKEDISDG